MSKRKNWEALQLAPPIGTIRLLAKGDLGQPIKTHYGFLGVREFEEYELLDKLADVLDGPNGLEERVLEKLQELSLGDPDDDRHGELLRGIMTAIHFIRKLKAKGKDADWLVYKLGRLVERAGLEDQKQQNRSKGGSRPKSKHGIMTWVRQKIERTPEASVRALYKRIPDDELTPDEVVTDDGVFQIYRNRDNLVFQYSDETSKTSSIKYRTFRAYVAAANFRGKK